MTFIYQKIIFKIYLQLNLFLEKHKIIFVGKKTERIKTLYPDSYDKIGFNCVVDPNSNNEDINSFFSGKLFEKNNVIYSPMHPVNGRSIYYPPSFLFSQKKSELSSTLKNIFDLSSNLDIESQYMFQQQNEFKSSLGNQIELPDICGHSGPCMPGVHRLFVTLEGDLYPCEKANESSHVMKIGDIYNGFDMNNALKMLNISSLDHLKCKYCYIEKNPYKNVVYLCNFYVFEVF